MNIKKRTTTKILRKVFSLCRFSLFFGWCCSALNFSTHTLSTLFAIVINSQKFIGRYFRPYNLKDTTIFIIAHKTWQHQFALACEYKIWCVLCAVDGDKTKEHHQFNHYRWRLETRETAVYCASVIFRACILEFVLSDSGMCFSFKTIEINAATKTKKTYKNGRQLSVKT